MATTPKPKTSSKIAPVDAYIAKTAPFAQPILTHLRDAVHEAVPGVEETIKWSRPFFLHKGIILGNISAFKQHCSFGLWGAEIAQALRTEGIASGEGMGTFGRITTLTDLPAKKKLVSYIRQAAKSIDDGVRTNSIMRPKVAKADFVVTAVLAAALERNKAVSTNFHAMAPSCQREYSMWIAEAKRDETREKRLATALEWIAEGKTRNWKYQA
jgi:uncharacterized protein YdeI (YjbR/CyaY-like superfamily)